MRGFLILVLAFATFLITPSVEAQSVSSQTAGLEKREGFFDLYVDKKTNKVKALIPVSSSEPFKAIYTRRLRAGLGSNPVGLDRGWGDRGVVIAFEKYGDKLIIRQENLTYRANPENPLEALAVNESFADSFLASLKVEASTNEAVLVDMTEFLSRDALSVVQHLKGRGQGSFSVASDRSFVDTTNSFAFPDNVEIDSFLTLTSQAPGNEVATTAASGKDATLIQHHSFVRLPALGFEPRIADPRMGALELVYIDYSAPLVAPIERRLALRHRLQKNEDGKTIKHYILRWCYIWILDQLFPITS